MSAASERIQHILLEMREHPSHGGLTLICACGFKQSNLRDEQSVRLIWSSILRTRCSSHGAAVFGAKLVWPPREHSEVVVQRRNDRCAVALLARDSIGTAPPRHLPLNPAAAMPLCRYAAMPP